MKLSGGILFLLFVGLSSTFAQNAPKDWTAWAPVRGDWAEFQVLVTFHGESRTPEELAKAKIKSLKVKCLIGGRMKGELPPEIGGVRTFRILYSNYGKFEGSDGFFEDFVEVRSSAIYRYFA